MKLLRSVALLVSVTIAAAALPAAPSASQALFAKTHGGEKEATVVGNWFKDKLPNWAMGRTLRNQFIDTWLPMDANFKSSKIHCPFVIRAAEAGYIQVHPRFSNGVDIEGNPTYQPGKDFRKLAWKQWPARYVHAVYPVETDSKEAELVAYAAWLFSEKENDLGNRVLTILRGRNTELGLLIDDYMAEKYGWKDAGRLSEWETWDAASLRPRVILIPEGEKIMRAAARESAAETAFAALVEMRGDTSGDPEKRAKQPTRMLAAIEGEIKLLKQAYGATEHLRKQENAALLQQITDSIIEDKTWLKDEWAKTDTFAKDPSDIQGVKKECDRREVLIKLDPQNINLRSQLGNRWYAWGNTDLSGNGCTRPEGIKKAIGHFKLLTEALPVNVPFALALGKCYQSVGDKKNARPCYEKVIELDGEGGHFGKMAKGLLGSMGR